MDYSENMAQMYKYEPQLSHFSKQQYSLHCTAGTEYLVKKLNYLYHLSDEMKHNYVLTTSVVDDICHLKINLKSFILSLTTALHNINPNMFFNISGVQIMVL